MNVWTRALIVALSLGGCADPAAVDTGPDEPLLFLVQRTRPNTAMEALYQGPVEVDQQGCFRLALEPDRHTVVWPFGSRLVRDQASLIVLDEDGDRLGRVGENLRLGGGEVPGVPDARVLTEEMRAAAAERCPGRFWIVGTVSPATPR